MHILLNSSSLELICSTVQLSTIECKMLVSAFDAICANAVAISSIILITIWLKAEKNFKFLYRIKFLFNFIDCYKVPPPTDFCANSG